MKGLKYSDQILFDLDYPVKRNDPKRIELVNKQIFPITKEAVCDAADVMRLGKDLFIQNGYLTNELAIDWFSRHLGNKYRVHKIEFLNNVFKTHMDALLCPIKEGYILYNEEVPIYSPNILSYFKENDWNLIPAPKLNSSLIPQGITTIPSINMNMLSLSEDKIIVEKSEENMIKFLKEEGFDVIEVGYKDCYKFGGSFHCATCDIHRNGNLKSYFLN